MLSQHNPQNQDQPGVTKVLIADKIDDEALTRIKSIPHVKCLYEPQLNNVNISINMKKMKPNVVVVRDTKFTQESIDAYPGLRLVIKHGDDMQNIDTRYCSDNGVIVARCTGQNVESVAELTIGLIIAVNRKMCDGIEVLKSGYWYKGAFENCLGLKDRTIGLIGFGKVAQRVCKIAKSLEMKVLVHTRTKHTALDKKMGFEYA